MNRFILPFFLAVLFMACKPASQVITVAAASDLQYALEDIKAAFNKVNPEIKVDIIYGSSGNLYQQLVNKAPFDMYFSADILFPNKLDSLKLSATKPKLYATGFLVIWTSKIDTSLGLRLFTSNEVVNIAIASPKHAPYGKRAIEFLKYYHLYDSVKNKLVEGENISQTAQFVLSGNAEAGIIALSLALSPSMQNAGKYILIDEKSHSPLEQAYIIVKNSETKPEVLSFYDFVDTELARTIFTKYGFRLPKE